MKKLLALLLSLTLVFSLVACGDDTEDTPGTDDPGTDDPATAEEVVLKWNIGADPKTLDPSLNGASDGGDVINNTFEGLVREKEGVVYPGIAESWDVSEDGMTITFHLRESKWSNGDPLTAHDFVYGWKHGMDPNTNSEYIWLWHYTGVVGAEEATNGESLDDVGISAPDDYTFVVELIQPVDYIISLTSFYHFMPLHQASVEAEGGEDGLWAKTPELAVSNGAYKLVSYEVGDRLILEKNEHYWNADNVGVDKIIGRFIDSEYTAYAAFQNNDLDIIPGVPAAEIPKLIAEDPQFHLFAALATYYYSFNLDNEILQNVKLREAMVKAIDRIAICDAFGDGRLPAAGMVPPGMKDHLGRDFFETAGDYGVALDDSSFDEAKALMVEAGYPNGDGFPTDLVILYNTNEGHKLVAEMVQQMWKDNLGIEVTLQNQEWGVFQTTRKEGNFDIARGGWGTDFVDPSGMLSIFTSDNAYNDPNYYNDAYDALLAESMSAPDSATHFEKLYEAQDMFMNDFPIMPIYHYTDSIYINSKVKGWSRSLLGAVDWTGVYIEE